MHICSYKTNILFCNEETLPLPPPVNFLGTYTMPRETLSEMARIRFPYPRGFYVIFSRVIDTTFCVERSFLSFLSHRHPG